MTLVSKLCHDVLEIAVDTNIDENLISLIFKIAGMRVNNLLAIQQQEEDVDGEWIVMSRKINIFYSPAI